MNGIKHIAKKLLLKTGLFKFVLNRDQFFILPYHSVVEHPNGFFPENSLSSFKKQMAHLAKHYRVIDFETLMDRIQKGRSLHRCVVITFDDGFLDNYKLAGPVLKKYNLPATVFLTTDFINNQTIPWFIKFRFAFMTTEKENIRMQDGELVLNFPLTTSQEKFSASNRFMAHLRGLTDPVRAHWLDSIFDELGIHDFSCLENMMLNWDQIREMSKQGFSFGAHTVSHPVLSQLDVERATQEIADSKKIIESYLDKTVISFAYPFGKLDDFSIELTQVLETLGFRCAVTTENDANNRNTNPFLLNRDMPWEMSILNNG